MVYHILYNKKSGNGTGEKNAHALDSILNGNKLVYDDLLKIKDYKDYFKGLLPEDKVVLCGGDGTLMNFVNNTNGIDYKNDIMMFSAGSGNDFLFDIGEKDSNKPVVINKYLKDLPIVEIDGVKKYFINNVGFGMDGYACEEADKLAAVSDKEINYAAITVKGFLLGRFRPRKAVITVDGKRYEFSNVWIAPTMHGRAYGGGMICAPNQDRLNKDKTLTCVVMHYALRVPTLILFTKLFKGTHVLDKKHVAVFTGKDITVEFSSPCAAQIDGETVLNVKKYRAYSV